MNILPVPVRAQNVYFFEPRGAYLCVQRPTRLGSLDVQAGGSIVSNAEAYACATMRPDTFAVMLARVAAANAVVDI